jgi:outer membrane protein OmpA-like peptidoglycan-associated protein
MITIRRLRCAAAAMGLLVGVSVILTLPQRVLAQASAAGDAVDGLSGTAPGDGSRLHVEPPGEAAPVAKSVPAAEGATLRPGPAIHADMAKTARGGRKPAALMSSTTMAFKPATIKPLPQAAEEDVAEQEPMAEPAAKTSWPSETIPAPAMAEPALSREAVVARLPDRTAGDARPGAAAEKEAKADDQQAALPPASDPERPSAIARLVFAPESATLSAEAEGMLKDLVASFPAHDEGSRLQLLAYASGEGMSASKARRLSLARALSVREYLIANGIDGTRMDVRALGDEAAKSSSAAGSPAGSPANRVDIAMIRR